MRFRLVRDVFLEHATLGALSNDTDPPWQTLEDTDRRLEADPSAKVKGKTAIPRGVYRLVLDYSPKFGCTMPHLLDVPGFAGIRFHSGFDVDDTEGCPLIGEVRSADHVLRSREGFGRLMAALESATARGELMDVEVL